MVANGKMMQGTNLVIDLLSETIKKLETILVLKQNYFVQVNHRQYI